MNPKANALDHYDPPDARLLGLFSGEGLLASTPPNK
jgi:hypothetical protein